MYFLFFLVSFIAIFGLVQLLNKKKKTTSPYDAQEIEKLLEEHVSFYKKLARLIES